MLLQLKGGNTMTRNLNHEEALKVKAFIAERAKEENLRIVDQDYSKLMWPEPDQLREAEIHVMEPGYRGGIHPYGGIEYSPSGDYYALFTWAIPEEEDSKVMVILFQAVDYAVKEFGREISMDCF
jgi:hypothetical protein